MLAGASNSAVSCSPVLDLIKTRRGCAVRKQVYYHIDCAGDQSPWQPLGGLSIQDSQPSAVENATGVSRLTENAAQPSTIPSSPAVPANGVSAAVTAGTIPSGSSAAQTDAKAAFQRRVHVHFGRLMAGGGVTPATAAAQALKLAAQG
jgi:hypothetical protein